MTKGSEPDDVDLADSVAAEIGVLANETRTIIADAWKLLERTPSADDSKTYAVRRKLQNLATPFEATRLTLSALGRVNDALDQLVSRNAGAKTIESISKRTSSNLASVEVELDRLRITVDELATAIQALRIHQFPLPAESGSIVALPTGLHDASAAGAPDAKTLRRWADDLADVLTNAPGPSTQLPALDPLWKTACAEISSEVIECSSETTFAGLSCLNVADRVRPETLFGILSDSRQHLAPGGFLAVTVADSAGLTVGDSLWIDPQRRVVAPVALAQMVSNAGFEEVELRPIGRLSTGAPQAICALGRRDGAA